MIEARKIRWLERLFVWEVRRVMRRRFYGVYVRGLPELEQALASARPLVICSNHSNWWDGFAAALTIPLFRERRLYLAQSETLLALYQPLRWLGAFGLDIHGPLQTLFDAIGPTLAPVDLSGYRSLFTPRMSMNKVWERWTQRGPVEPGNE